MILVTLLSSVFGSALATASAAPVADAGAIRERAVMPAPPPTESVFPPSAAQRDFNSGPAGWSGYQEFSILCWVRGLTCPKWDTTWEDGQPDPNWRAALDEPRVHGASGQPGDGFLRFHGTSLALAPCTPQAGNANWDSPLFTYDIPNSSSWRLQLDVRQSYLLVGDGHAGWGVDLVDSTGRVVMAAVPAQPTLPTNQWRHIDVAFDGSRLEYGEKYRIRVKVVVMHAETAGSFGDIDIDNVRLVASTAPAGPDQLTKCDRADNLNEAAVMLTEGEPRTACGLTNLLGNEAAPLLDEATRVANTEPVNSLLDRGGGAFFIVDRSLRQFAGWFLAPEALPPSDPRQLFVWAKHGTAGKAADYVFVFLVFNNQETVKALTGGPGGVQGALAGVIEGQVGNAAQVLNNGPRGELLDIDPQWSEDNVLFHVNTILRPLLDPTPSTPAAVGGVVWEDRDGDGIRDPDEPRIAGVPVTLLDCDDTVLGQQTSSADGAYLFDPVEPTFEPEAYCVEFDRTGMPSSTEFALKRASGSTPETDSDADRDTGRTDEIFVSPGERTLHWDAGLVIPDESGQLLNGADPSLCLTAGTNGVPDLEPCVAEPVDLVQFWTSTSTRTLQVTSDQGLVCLDAGADSFSSPPPEDSPVLLEACDGLPGQQWAFDPNGSIVNVASDMCLAPAGGQAVTSAEAVLRTCTATLAQQWTLTPVLAIPLGDRVVVLSTLALLALLTVAALLRRRSNTPVV